MTEKTTNTENKPIEKYRVGSTSVTAWKSKGGFKNYTFQRSYKDAEGKWQNTNNYNLQDLLCLGKIIKKITDQEVKPVETETPEDE